MRGDSRLELAPRHRRAFLDESHRRKPAIPNRQRDLGRVCVGDRHAIDRAGLAPHERAPRIDVGNGAPRSLLILRESTQHQLRLTERLAGARKTQRPHSAAGQFLVGERRAELALKDFRVRKEKHRHDRQSRHRALALLCGAEDFAQPRSQRGQLRERRAQWLAGGPRQFDPAFRKHVGMREIDHFDQQLARAVLGGEMARHQPVRFAPPCAADGIRQVGPAQGRGQFDLFLREPKLRALDPGDRRFIRQFRLQCRREVPRGPDVLPLVFVRCEFAERHAMHARGSRRFGDEKTKPPGQRH